MVLYLDTQIKSHNHFFSTIHVPSHNTCDFLSNVHPIMHRQRIVSSGFSLNIHLETQFYLTAHMLKTSLGHMASPASYLDIAEYS